MYGRTKKTGRDTLTAKQRALAGRLAARIQGGDFQWAVHLDKSPMGGKASGDTPEALAAWLVGRERMNHNRDRSMRVVLTFGDSSVSTLPKVAAMVATILS